jgi:hypothetical protein
METYVPSCQQSQVGEYEIKNHFCDKECETEWKQQNWVGGDHPLWNGGVDWYRAIRSAVASRGWRSERKDNLADACAMCGDTDSSLHLHHIVPLLSGGTNDEYNYLTLCVACHRTVESFTKRLDVVSPILSQQ